MVACFLVFDFTFGFLHNSYQSIETRVAALTQAVTEAPMWVLLRYLHLFSNTKSLRVLLFLYIINSITMLWWNAVLIAYFQMLLYIILLFSFYFYSF